MNDLFNQFKRKHSFSSVIYNLFIYVLLLYESRCYYLI